MPLSIYYGIWVMILMIMANDEYGATTTTNAFSMLFSAAPRSLSISRKNFRSTAAQHQQHRQASSSWRRKTVGASSQSERRSFLSALSPLPRIQATIPPPDSPIPIAPPIKRLQSSCCSADRRAFLVQHAGVAAAAAAITFTSPARAANLPKSTGADLSATGTVETLIPVLRLLDSLQTMKNLLKTSSSSIPQVLAEVARLARNNNNNGGDEQSFKRIFDAYSQPVSYKQKFMDQNAFLVYYTQGYDGPNRPRLEQEDAQESNENNMSSAKQQTLQYGFRNDAWTAWNDFVAELDYFAVKNKQTGGSSSSSSGLDQDDVMVADLLEPLNRTIDAVAAYVSLAPERDVLEASKRVRQPTQN